MEECSYCLLPKHLFVVVLLSKSKDILRLALQSVILLGTITALPMKLKLRVVRE